MKKKDLWELLKKREEAKKPKEVKEPEGDQNGSVNDNTADNNG